MLIYVANFIVSALAGTLLFVFVDVSSFAVGMNISFLILSLEIPTFYMLLANRKKLDKNDNELLVPSALITGFTFVVNIIFYSVCIIVKSSNLKLFILYTIIFHCIILSVLLITKALTDYIRKQHK